jgi:hypothetical protein
MVPHSRLRGIQQSAEMLRNRSMSLKLQKTILITIYLTVMCKTCRRRRGVCRRRYLQPGMSRLRRFRRKRFILWTYWRRPVARFPRRRRGRQSEHGRRRGDLGLASTVNFACLVSLLRAATKLGNAAAGSAPPCELSLRGRGGGGSGVRGGVVKVSRLIVILGSRG